MYIQPIFLEDRIDELHGFIKSYSLATLVTSTPALDANLLPLEIVQNHSHGILRGHIARANPLWHTTANGAEVIAVFQGANGYISPRWYVNGQRSGKVAPSWNYTAVLARGCIRFIEDTEWLRCHLSALTLVQESARENPWGIADASSEFIATTLQHLVGFEIELSHLEGKRFLSQHRSAADRESIARHLRAEHCGAAVDLADDIERSAKPDKTKPI